MTDSMSVTGGDVTQTTISGLTSSTKYIVEVAAINIVGSGPYSFSIVEETDS